MAQLDISNPLIMTKPKFPVIHTNPQFQHMYPLLEWRDHRRAAILGLVGAAWGLAAAWRWPFRRAACFANAFVGVTFSYTWALYDYYLKSLGVRENSELVHRLKYRLDSPPGYKLPIVSAPGESSAEDMLRELYSQYEAENPKPDL